MAILFSPSVAGLMAGRGILVPMGMTTNAQSNVVVSLTVYSTSQAQPLANTIADNWTSYNSTYLFHMQNVQYKLDSPTSNTQSGLIINANTPTSNTALNTGTASWCIIWCSNVPNGSGSAGSIGHSTLPNSQFLVGPVTYAYGNGIVRLSNLSVTSGSTYTFVDSTIYFNRT